MAKNKLYIEFANEIGEFPINVGSVFNYEYSEKLDSASVIISKIDRKLNIKPNDECRIFCNDYIFVGENNANYNQTYYLIDTIYCKEITLNGEIQYQYTIELKSLTGYLDLIQLPNRTLNHSLVSGQKLILDYIEQFVELYAPKIKHTTGGTWKYKPLFEIDTGLEVNGVSFIERFSEPCRDLSFSQPTLRQALSGLMLQVGCLPKIIKRGDSNILSFLDFNEKPKKFMDIDKSQNYTTYSYASDSYVNTLVNMSDNVLDDNIPTITENISFRDPQQAILKQKENLFLNTIYPIYSVDKFVIKYPLRANASILPNTPFKIDTSSYYFTLGYSVQPVGIALYSDDKGGVWTHFGSIDFSDDTKCFRIVKNENGSVERVETLELTSRTNITAANNVIVSGVSIGERDLIVLDGKVSFTNLDTLERTENAKITIVPSTVNLGTIYYLQEVDATKLCVERNKRNLLNTDFWEMQNVQNINELSQYLYGTVTYDIGGTKIEGFSSHYTFTEQHGLWDTEKTYIQNISNFLSRFFLDNVPVKNSFFGLPEEIKITYSGIEIVQISYEFPIYTGYIFEVQYKPLNTFRMNVIKEEENLFKIEQLDTSENAITNFNDIVLVEQQKVNRLGNEVVTKNQRTEYFSAINGLNTQFDGYIVFSKTISVGYEDFKVNYIASKDYVLKNYFASVQTKYRAYEYVAYNQSIVRKENTTIFARIGRDYYDGDDYIYFGDKRELNNKHLEYLFLSGASSYDSKHCYKCVGNGDDFGISLYKTDLAVMITKDVIVFNTQAFDSVSYGIRLEAEGELLGGVQQSWYTKSQSTFENLSLAFINNDDIEFKTSYDENYILDVMRKVYALPYIENPDYDNAMYIVDNNKSSYLAAQGRTYYLDKQEKLNQTIQFIFYTDDDGIKWTTKLLELCNFVNYKGFEGERYWYIPDSDEEFNVFEEKYTNIDETKLKKVSQDNYENSFVDGAFYLRWAYIGTNLPWTKMVYKINGVYYDLIGFTNKNNLRNEYFYITLNDTRTDKVAYNKNGLISFNEYVVAKNTLNREVVKV